MRVLDDCAEWTAATATSSSDGSRTSTTILNEKEDELRKHERRVGVTDLKENADPPVANELARLENLRRDRRVAESRLQGTARMQLALFLKSDVTSADRSACARSSKRRPTERNVLKRCRFVQPYVNKYLTG